MAMNNVHSETYSLLIELYARHPAEKNGLYNFAAIYLSTVTPVSLFITFLIAFFASLDGVVKENLAAQFASRCSPWKLVRFYGF